MKMCISSNGRAVEHGSCVEICNGATVCTFCKEPIKRTCATRRMKAEAHQRAIDTCHNVEMTFKAFAVVRTLGALETVLEECDYEHMYQEDEYLQGVEDCTKVLIGFGNWLEDRGVSA